MHFKALLGFSLVISFLSISGFWITALWLSSLGLYGSTSISLGLLISLHPNALACYSSC